MRGGEKQSDSIISPSYITKTLLFVTLLLAVARSSQIRVNVKQDVSGIITLSSAQAMEEIPPEEQAEEEGKGEEKEGEGEKEGEKVRGGEWRGEERSEELRTQFLAPLELLIWYFHP